MKIIGENVFQYMFYTQKTTINTETGAEEPIPNVYEVVCATWNRVKYQAPQASYHIVDVKERRDNHVRWIEDGKKSGIIFLIDQYDKWYAKKAAEACAFDFDVDEALEAEANEAKANTSAFEEVNDEEVEAII